MAVMQQAGYVVQWLPERAPMRDGLVDLLADLVREGVLHSAWIEGFRDTYVAVDGKAVLCVRSEPAGEVVKVRPGEVLMVAIEPGRTAQFRLTYAAGTDPRDFVYVPR